MERARLASPSDETDYIHWMKRREGIWPSRKEQKLDEFVEFLDRQPARSRDFEQGETHNFFTWENSQNRHLTLKQARRRFCINHASEAAAMRKMSRPKVSDAAAVEKFQAAVMAMAEKSLTEEKRNLQEMPEQRRAAFSRLFRLKEQTLRNEEFRRRTTNKADNKKHRLKGKVSDEIEACEATGYEGETENRRIREKGESSQSSKSSRGDRSCSTSNSGESISSEKGSKPHMSKDVRWRAIRRVEMNQGRIRLKNFNLLRRLGCGDIGTVYVAQLVGSDYLFALKVMDEEFLWNRQKMPRAETEREILQMLDHPFLPTLYSHFSEDNLSCLVMEYCPGGDLHALRQRKPLRSFPEPAARFYAAEVLLALEYLHMLGVIYRDLKPENILVREDGHVMLSDFDLSLRCSVSPVLLECTRSFETQADESPAADTPCNVSCLPASGKSRSGDPANSMPMLVAEPTEARSNSFVGTHEYLAPEIVKGDGHGSSVDWWTLGIFLYELLFGTTPFKGRDNEETLSNIVEMNLSFPESFEVTTQARDLIRGLLVKDPEKRIGSVRGAAEIKRHRFFDGLNWALIRSAIPPETPADDDDLVLPRAYATPAMACGKKQGRCLDLWNDRSQFGLF